MPTKYFRGFFAPSGNGYGVAFPEFPGCISVGEDMQDAMSNAEEALALHIEGMTEEGEAIPEPVAVDAPLPDWLEEDAPPASMMLLVRADLPGKALRLNITMTEDVVALLDRAAQRLSTSRSGYLAHAVRETARREERRSS